LQISGCMNITDFPSVTSSSWYPLLLSFLLPPTHPPTHPPSLPPSLPPSVLPSLLPSSLSLPSSFPPAPPPVPPPIAPLVPPGTAPPPPLPPLLSLVLRWGQGSVSMIHRDARELSATPPKLVSPHPLHFLSFSRSPSLFLRQEFTFFF